MQKFLIVFILFLLVGCGNSGLTSEEKEVYKLYENAIENLAEYDSYTLDDNINIAFSKDGAIKDFDIGVLIKAINNDTSDFHCQLGSLNLFYKNGIVYTNIIKANVKAALPKVIMNAKNFKIVPQRNKSAMITGTKESTDYGTKLNLQFSADGIERILKFIELENSEFNKIDNIKSSIFYVTMNIDKNGMLIDQTITFDATCTVLQNDDSVSDYEIKFKSTEVISNINNTIIDYPQDLESYKSLSVDELKEFLKKYGIIEN